MNLRTRLRPLLALPFFVCGLLSQAMAQDGAIPLRSGQPAPHEGVLLDRASAAKVRVKLAEHRMITAELRARSAEASAATSRAVAAEQIAELHRASAEDQRALVRKSEQLARAERRAGGVRRVLAFIGGALLGRWLP